MTAEERIKKWKAEGEYAKALVVMSSLYRRKRTKKEICKPYGLTEKELDELLEYDVNANLKVGHFSINAN